MQSREIKKNNLRAAACTHIVVNKEFQFIFWIVQSQQPLEKFRQKWSWLLYEHSHQHVWILLFRLEERQMSSFLNNLSQLCHIA